MKTKIIREDCIACGNCSAICPEIYDYDKDGIAFCHHDNNEMTLDVDSNLEQLVIEAYENCPTQAIAIDEK